MKKAVVLFSGGLDSTTVLFFAKQQGFALYPLSIEYGQRHSIELEAAKKILQHAHIQNHKIFPLALNTWGGSALTASSLKVPKQKNFQAYNDIPITYVPGRNLIFLSLAIAYAETLNCQDIFIGINAIDYSNYPDCRPEFLEQFSKTANLATAIGQKKPFCIHAPLVHLFKHEIIQLGHSLGVDYSMTISCYDPTASFKACGECDACHLRKNGFQKAHLPDPTVYVDQSNALE